MASLRPANGNDRVLSVRNLASVGLDRWFDVGPVPPDRKAALDRLKTLLAADETRQPFRFLAIDGTETVRGKIGGYVSSNGRFTFWAAYHAANQSESEKHEVARLLVEHCVATAFAWPGVRFVETKPAFDTPDLESFKAALRFAGLSEVSKSHLYALAPLAGTVAAVPPRGITRLPCLELDRNRLSQLFAATQAETFDRAQRDNVLSATRVIEELRLWAGEVALSLWFAAIFDGHPIGYVFCGLTDTSDGTKEGFIVELGVLPEFRRRGIGHWLVREVVCSMEQLGVSVVKSLIDDDNYPSKDLHIKVGFVREPGFFSTWRRTIRG